MTLVELKNNIHTNSIPNLCIFTGDEVGVMDIYINQISKSLMLTAKRFDTVLDVINNFGKSSLFKQDYLYIVRDDKEFVKSEKLWKLVNDKIGSNRLILIYTNLDKRTKFYSANKECIVEFNRLSNHLLSTYIRKHIMLSDSNCEKLIDVCDGDYSRILLELDKVSHYAKHHWDSRGYKERDGGFTNFNECFEELLEQGVIYQPPKDAIFDLVDAIMNYKPHLVYELYDNCKRVGEANLVIVSVLYNAIKAALVTKTGTDKDIERVTGRPVWAMKKSYSNIPYPPKALLYMLDVVQEVEVGIKQGLIEDALAVDYLLARIL